MSKELVEGNEKGVNEMEKEIRVGNESRTERGKGVTNMSPVVQKDIDTVFAINTGITQYMVSDNAFYRYIHQHYADKSSGRMPYLVDNNVLHADKKHLKCVADNHIKITPYALYEGAAAAGLAIYRNTMQQLSSKVNFNFLIQSYFTYSALCLGISSNGKINLITSNAAIINAIPADDSDKRGALKRVNPITDDYENGIVQCVELIPKPSGYVLRPAIINAAKQDYLVLPLEWVNYLISYIHNILKVSVCKISYYDPNNQLQTIVASNKPIRGNPRHIISCDYIRETKNCVGWIRAVDIKTGEIISFPVSHFHKIEPLK
jgi:hypothetical protein